MVLRPKKLMTLLSNQEIKVMKATAKIIPGIAYPEIEKIVNTFNSLLLVTLFPQFVMKLREINIMLDKKTNNIVFKNNFIKFKSAKCFGKLIVQYNICKTGKRKLIKKTTAQKVKARNDFRPVRLMGCFFFNPLLVGV